MIEIEGPDGTIYEFPDGTDQNTMRTAMQKVYGGPAAVSEQQRGFGAALYDNIIGNPDDGVQSYGEQLGTWLNRAGESMTLGLAGDEASAGITGMLPGRDYESELARYRQNEEDMSTAGQLTADLAGAGVGVVGSLLAAPAVGIAAPATTLGRVGLGAGIGAGAGATQGFMEGEGGVGDRLSNAGMGAALGGALGGVVPAIGGMVGRGLRNRATNRAINEAAAAGPSTAALRAQADELYNAVDAAGVQVSPEAFNRARSEITDYLTSNTGFDQLPGPGSLTPQTSRVVDIMAAMGDQGEPIPFRQIDQLRRQAQSAAGNFTNRADQQAGTAVIDQLDNFIQRLNPDDVVGGADVGALQSGITKAREVWGTMGRSRAIDEAMEAGQNYRSGEASGIKNQIASILRNPKKSRGFSSAEREALRRVVDGSVLETAADYMGSGIGQAATTVTGALMGSIPGAIVGNLASQASRSLAGRLSQRSADRARSAIASGMLRDPMLLQSLEGAGQTGQRVSDIIGAILATTSNRDR